MLHQHRNMLKVVVLVPLSVFFIFIAIYFGGLVSYSVGTRIGVHSLLAFWISIPTTIVLLTYQKEKTRPHIILMSALLFSIILHIGSAGKNLLNVSLAVHRTLSDTVADFLDLALFGALLACAAIYYYQQSKSEEFIATTKPLNVIILILPFAIYGIVWFFILPILTQTSLIFLSFLLAIVALIGFSLTIALFIRTEFPHLALDKGYFIAAMLLFVVSIIALLATLPSPSIGWEYSETLQMAGFVVFCLALSIPFLKSSGYTRKGAYTFAIGLILIAYFPFFITITIESLSLNVIIEPLNLLAYSIVHIGAGSLAVMTAILLYIYPKRKTAWNHYPLILIFGLWASVTFVLLFLLAVPSFAPLGEPITPYTVGSILTLVLLLWAIYWTANPPPDDAKPPTVLQLSLILAGIVAAIVGGEIINQAALSINPALVSSPLGGIIIICTNLVIMFAFALLIFLLAARAKGKITIELFVVLFLAMWIFPNILKSYYNLWQSGWWVSELYLFGGLLAGPPLLAVLYIRALHDIEESHNKASMYADLLMHDITNFNQMMMTSFELLSSDDLSPDERRTLAENGCNVISVAGQLISNVRLLSETAKLDQTQPIPTNLISTIETALDIFSNRVKTKELSVEFKPDRSKAVVFGNELIINIFLNILYSVLESYLEGTTVVITIKPIEISEIEYWQTDVKTSCRSQTNKRSYSSILGLLSARTITEALRGTFTVKDLETDTDGLERILTVQLPLVKEFTTTTKKLTDGIS